jgi:hypothetical protein
LTNFPHFILSLNYKNLEVPSTVFVKKMPLPFWKKDSSKDSHTAPSNGNNDNQNGDCKKNKEKVNYKARLEHKQYLVSSTLSWNSS